MKHVLISLNLIYELLKHFWIEVLCKTMSVFHQEHVIYYFMCNEEVENALSTFLPFHIAGFVTTYMC